MMGLSVVIPSFNSAPWLESTLLSLDDSLSNSNWKAEIIVVNDGSTDNSIQILEEFKKQSGQTIKVISQQNKGRFLARWAGIQKATEDYILLLDSRVLLDPDSLSYVESQIRESNSAFIWNAYVRTDESCSLPGLFWDVPTRMFWGDFLQNPHKVSFGEKDFDKYPKGTGCLLLERSLLIDSYKEVWPEGNSALVSDDTKLLRNLVKRQEIILDPGFLAYYRPRISMKSFVSHTFQRGTLFVDSYAGTSISRKVFIALMALLPILFIVLASTGLIWPIVFAILALLLVPASLGAIRRASPKSLYSYLLLVVPFGILFWAGLIRGIFVHRHHFGLKTRNHE